MRVLEIKDENTMIFERDGNKFGINDGFFISQGKR